jgi:hypothetical protein
LLDNVLARTGHQRRNQDVNVHIRPSPRSLACGNTGGNPHVHLRLQTPGWAEIVAKSFCPRRFVMIARSERGAQVVASLNDPNIAAIY